MRIIYQFLALFPFIVYFGEAERAGFNSELLEEWELWKTQHGKSYAHRMEELERHMIWTSNRKYIEEHNANADAFGYTLAMNHFGDLVRYDIKLIICLCFSFSLIPSRISILHTSCNIESREGVNFSYVCVERSGSLGIIESI